MSEGITPGKPLRLYESTGSFTDYSTEEVVARALNSFRGWQCGAGVQNLCISFDGDVQSASCGVVSGKSNLGTYGNVFEDFKLDSSWITCPKDFCSCGADLFIPKFKNSKHSNLLRFTTGVNHDLSLRRENISAPVAIERTFSARNKQVFWEIGRRCNYNCSYCHELVHNDFEKHKTLEMLLYATDLLEQRFAQGEKINFAISGGEPTLNPDYLAWIRELNTRGHKISTHSNGSRTPEYYRDLISLSDLNLSAHFEFFTEQSFLRVIEGVVDEISLRRTAGLWAGHLEVMLMSTPGNLTQVRELEAKIASLNRFRDYATMTLMPIRDHQSIEHENEGDKLLTEYTSEELLQFGSSTQDNLNPHEKSHSLHFSSFDKLDELNDPMERRERLKQILDSFQ